jgi:long-chain fatty acid transport protein
LAGAFTLAACTLGARSATASNALDTPDGGTEQMARGGAWVARADMPIAAYYNPAGLVTQASGVSLGAQLMLRSHCFDRRNEAGQPVTPGAGFAAPPDEVCADITPFPNPQLAATFRLHDQFAIGLAVVGPHAHGKTTWPSTISYQNNFGVDAEAPSPQRYLLLEADAIALFPTISVAFAPLKTLAIGAGFTWGIANFDLRNVNEASSPARCPDPAQPCESPGNLQPDNFENDVLARVDGTDAFIPGFVVGVLWQPSREIDLAGWYRWSDAIAGAIDLHTEAPYYTNAGQLNPNPVPTDVSNAGNFVLPIPMEARIGVRYHHPRKGARAQDWVTQHGDWARDAIAEDVFDVEIDLTWAHNSQIDKIDVTFNDRYVINGTAGGRIPLDAAVVHNYSDSIGVRVGGEYVPIPDLLALRLGGFFESKSADDTFNNIDFQASERGGVGGGVGLRLDRFDINVAYQHTFFGDIDNGGAGEILAISGDPATNNRTRQTVNGGSTNSSLDEIGLSAAAHW